MKPKRMIVEVDHIAFASRDVEEEIAFLEGLGYALKFFARGIPNLRIKRALMRTYTETQDLALLTSPHNISIELVGHGHQHGEYASLIPVMAGVSRDSAASFNGVPFPDSGHGAAVSLRQLDTPILTNKSGGERFTFSRCVQITNEPDATVLFWEAFGFRPVSTSSHTRTLRFVSPFHKEMSLDIVQSSSAIREQFLDSAGFNCLAFISSNAELERQRIGAVGFAATEIEETVVNKKHLQVFFVRGPAGELAEVISVRV